MNENHTNPIELFVTWMTMRGMSERTVARRRCSLGSFTRFIAPLPLDQADRELVEEWIGSHRTARTKHAYRSDLSAFYSWGVRRRVLPWNPVAETDTIIVPKSLPRPVPPAAVPAIVALAPEPLRLALMLAAYAGLRCSELCALSSDDVHLSPVPLLIVRGGKGNKDRTVPLHPVLASELGRRRPQGRYFAVSAESMGRRASAHMRALGYDCTIHQLRASFVTELARVLKGNVVAVGRVVGHESPTTTMGYCGWDGGETGSAMPGMYPDAA